MKLKSLLAAITALTCAVLSPSPAEATPVTWLVSGFGFDDGGKLGGSFVFDAALNTYSNIHLTTTTGTSASGATYGDPFLISPGNSTVMLAVQDSTLPLPGQPLLVMLWDAPLTDAGGVAHLNFGFEGFVANDLSTPGRRVLTVIGDVSTAVPEPGTSALVVLALAALVSTRSRARLAVHSGGNLLKM